jgi:predicted permease
MTEDPSSQLFTIGERSVYAEGRYAEQSLFEMFTLPFVQGSAQTAFSQLHSLVITQKTVKKFFGDESSVLGKIVRMNNKQDYVVTGVLKDIPENSSLQFDWVAPFEVWYAQSPWAYKWENNCLSTYVELKPGASLASVNAKLYDFVQKRAPQSNGHIFLFGMNDWHLRDSFANGKQTGGGRIEYVRLFSTIAWIILLIACINFMNLATARSEKRAREVGVRKVLGAGKRKLVAQFIGEALIMAGIAAGLALVLMTLSLRFFDQLTEKNLSLGLDLPLHLAVLLGTTLVCGLVAGSYPAFYLSSFNPVFVLKGIKLKKGSAAMIRKGLVVLQFAVSIFLIIGTIIIYQQIQHVKDRTLGFNKDGLMEITMQGDLANHVDAVRQDLITTGFVSNVALSDHTTIDGGNNTDDLNWQAKPPGAKILVSWRDVSPEYISTSGMRIVDGRDFTINDTADLDNPPKTVHVLITESMAKLMGKGSAVGKMITDRTGAVSVTVVGVVKNYLYGYMYGSPDPVIIFCVPPRFENLMYVRIREDAPVHQALEKIAAVMKKDNPAYPFQYRFVDDQFNNFFTSEMLVSQLSRVFAALAILVSCLGLFGLASYTAERRKKEIGIRKVLGANAGTITALVSAEFLQLVAIAALLAFPCGWWAMQNWLKSYPYRIAISWWVFALAGSLAVVIALATVSYQAIRAAVANPANSLRSE